MKKLLVFVVALGFLSVPLSQAQARKSNQSDHFKNNPPYNCSVTKKPSAPQWVDAKFKKDKIGNSRILLIWEDADRAHDVEIRYGVFGSSSYKVKKTGDDGDQKIKELKNGSYYWFKIRGVSNCGKSGWTNAKNTSLPGKPNRYLP